MLKLFYIISLLICARFTFGQQVQNIDTVPISLNDAEEQFIKNNYALLAQKFNVDASKALVRQAGLINNPNLYYENSIHNRYSGKYFPTAKGTPGDVNTQGEFILQYNWLFSVAGKRSKSVSVAKAQAEVAQFQFDDLIRSLLFALRSDFYELSYGLQSVKLFDSEISSLQAITQGYETQYTKGNISLREITRMRALLFSLQSDRLALVTQLRATLGEFSGLLNNAKPVWYTPVFNEADLDNKYAKKSNLNLSELLTQALSNRPDLKAVEAEVKVAEAQVKLQNATGVPDIMVQGVFDRNGSYIQNYNGAAIGIPFAVFNRNQGNRKYAVQIKNSADQQVMQKQVSVQNDVFSSYQKLIDTDKMTASLSKDFSADFNTLLKGVESNYAKKNISLLEFVDLFESYKDVMVNYNNIKAQRLSAFEELNFNVGKDVFKQ